MADQIYNQKLRQALLGRFLPAALRPEDPENTPVFSLWGEEAGIEPSDVHASWTYRVYCAWDGAGRITGVGILVDGELLSPCQGYAFETLDRFDYPHILRYCLERTEA